MTPSSVPSPIKQPIALFLVILGLLLVVYGPSMKNCSFVRDDVPIIQDNLLLRSARSIPKLLTTGYWFGPTGHGNTVQEYRPTLMLSYALNAGLCGTAPHCFRIFNILLHALNGLFLMLLLRRHYSSSLPAYAALIFVLLPVHTEMAAAVFGRSESLALFFLLLTFLSLDHPVPHMRTAALFYTLAVFTKEQTVMFPLVWLLFDRCYCSDQVRTTKSRQYIFTTLLLIAVLSLLIRTQILSHPFGGRWSDYFNTAPYYIRVLTIARFTVQETLPSLLTGFRFVIEYARPFVPDATLFDPVAWMALGTGLCFLIAALWGVIQMRSRSAFWLLMAFLFWLPTSNLIIPLDSLGTDRFLYTPAMAYAVGLAYGICKLPIPFRAFTLMICLAGFGYQSYNRAKVYRNDLTLALAQIQINPNSDRSWLSLSVSQLKAGQPRKALISCRKAEHLNPRNPDVYYNLACAYIKLSDWNAAELALRRASEMYGNDADTWFNLGFVSEKKGHPDAAVGYYSRGLILRPQDDMGHWNMARLSLSRGQLREAAYHYEQFLTFSRSDDPQKDTAIKILTLIKNDSARTPQR